MAFKQPPLSCLPLLLSDVLFRALTNLPFKNHLAMRSLCANDAQFWQPAPVQRAPSELPHWIIKKILEHLFESDFSIKMKDHVCDVRMPCTALRQDSQNYIPLTVVCKAWRMIVHKAVDRYSFCVRALKPPSDLSLYMTTNIARLLSLDGRYRVHSDIEDDGDKGVFRAYDYRSPNGCHGKTDVVIKVSNDSSQHENETAVYSWLENADTTNCFVPRLHYAGPYPFGYHGLVLEPLGLDLERLRGRCHQRRFTPKMTLAVAIQTVRIYEKLHAQGWLHTNAKTGNFAIGPDMPGKCNKIYVFDFEYSTRIEQTPRTGVECDGWNNRFKPVTWSLGLSPSRRDDMEGLAYVLSYLERGSHPWQYSHGDTGIWCTKISTPTKKLFEGMDPVYMRYFDEIKALAWGEIPDYEGILQRFADVWERRGYGGVPGEIDWWDEFKLRTNTSR